MSLRDGFTAIEEIKISGQKLSDTVAKIENLEPKLEGLIQVQSKLEEVLTRTGLVFADLERSSGDLSKQFEAITGQVNLVPTQVDAAIARAENLILDHQVQMKAVLDSLPKLFEKAIELKLQSLLSKLETRLADSLREELKDTRLTMRDAIEVNSRSLERKLDTASREIVAEMPRTLFGRRGK